MIWITSALSYLSKSKVVLRGALIMTLVITEVSCLGIVMVADSAYVSAGTHEVREGPKIIPMPWLRAGVSLWGGPIPAPPEGWLGDFVDQQKRAACPDIPTFAARLAVHAQAMVDANGEPTSGRSTLGFHVAGYLQTGNPVMYHVHNGPSQVLLGRFKPVDPNRVNANDDLPEEGGRMLKNLRGQICWRNGDYTMHALLWDNFEKLATNWDPLLNPSLAADPDAGFCMPSGATLYSRTLYRATQVHAMSLLMRTSNIMTWQGINAPHISGDVRCLTFGEHDVPAFLRTASLSKDGVSIK